MVLDMTIEEFNEYQQQLTKKYLTKKQIKDNEQKIREMTQRYSQTKSSTYLKKLEYYKQRNEDLEILLEEMERYQL